MRRFRNPPDRHGVPVHIHTDAGLVVIQPGEKADVEFPAWQPCPDLLEEIGSTKPASRAAAASPASSSSAAAASEPSEAAEE